MLKYCKQRIYGVYNEQVCVPVLYRRDMPQALREFSVRTKNHKTEKEECDFSEQ